MKQLLQSIHFQRESKSFVDCLYAVVTAAKFWEGPKYRLSGMTGMAFKFSVHQNLHRISVTAYGQYSGYLSFALLMDTMTKIRFYII